MKLKISDSLKGLPTIDYRKLEPFQKNLKDLSKENYNKLLKSFKEFGFIVPIFKWGNKVIDAHQRLRVLTKEKIEPFELPFIEIEAENEIEAKKKVLVISSQYGKLTQTGLDEFAFDLDDEWLKETINFDALSFSEADEDETKPGLTDPDDVPEKPKKPKTKLGDMYELGSHFLLCGDSTNEAHVKKLMGGGEPILMVTDPPYGVSYDPSWREGADLGVGKRSKGKVTNDDLIDWSKAYNLFKGNVAYVWHASFFTHIVAQNLETCGFKIVSSIIWVKQHFAMSRGDYHWQHEPCWYVVRKGEKHNWQGSRKETTVWEIKNNNSFGNSDAEKTWGHGTQKPVECMLKPILNNSKKGELVYDPFLGSGTTLIACEQSERLCSGMELDPGYCDVIIQRWQEFTGKKARKL